MLQPNFVRVMSLIVPIIVLTLAGCFRTGFTSNGTISVVTPHVDQSGLEIDTRNGAIYVVADSTINQVTVEADVRCTGESQSVADERAASSDIKVERGSDGILKITPVFPGNPRGGDSAKISVRIPNARGIKLHTSNGAISLDGGATATTSQVSSNKAEADPSGSSASLSPPATAESSAAKFSGAVEANTSNGSLKLVGVDGDVSAKSSNGAIEIRAVQGNLIAQTSNGSINATLSQSESQKAELRTSNGNVDIELTPSFKGKITMETSNGSVRHELPASNEVEAKLNKKDGYIVVGSDQSVSTLKTSNGSITIRSAK
jgi:DUF4097 and DUF4098 domain-containing protein YvlB